MKTICKMLINLGKIFFVWDVIFIVAIIANSFSIKGEVNYGNRCFINEDFSYLKEYKKDDITLENEELKCNTYYLIYNTTLNKDEIILFLNDITYLLRDNKSEANVHVIVNSNEYQIMASIVDYKINYINTYL